MLKTVLKVPGRRFCYSYKSPFPTKFYYRKRLERIEHEQFVEGPPPSWPRSFFPNWNHVSELRAFAFRINEPMNVGLLRNAFIDESCHKIPYEELRIRKLNSLPESDNTELSQLGLKRIFYVSKLFVSELYPLLPEEALNAVCNVLTSERELRSVGKNLGIEDLIIAASYPYEKHVISKALCALVETLAKHRSSQHATQFVHDFICSQLITKDIMQLWNPEYPEALLNELLGARNKQPAEPRLIFETEVKGPLPMYTVGIFSDKKILATGSGETINIAKHEAMFSAIKVLLEINRDHCSPISTNIDRIEVEN